MSRVLTLNEQPGRQSGLMPEEPIFPECLESEGDTEAGWCQQE